MRFGDTICLGNEATQAVLSFNINEQILGEDTYAVTTSKTLTPSLRNVFTVVAASEAGDKFVRYGEKIRLQT